MEDVLDLYAEAATAPDPARPLVCFDEQPFTLRADAHPGAPCAPGRPARVDYEYARQGTACCLLSFAPFHGWRHVTVSAHRANADFAHAMRHLADVDFPDASRIRVVLDNLSTHTAAALYQTFAPAEARRIAAKLEFHYTPKHASWLNMAEAEASLVARQCLGRRRIGSLDTLVAEVRAWRRRADRRGTIDWKFRVRDARRVFRYDALTFTRSEH